MANHLLCDPMKSWDSSIKWTGFSNLKGLVEQVRKPNPIPFVIVFLSLEIAC